MPTARTEVTSAVVDGVIYVIGGFRATGGNTDLVEAYDSAGDSWSVKMPLPQNIDHAGAAAVGEKVYVVGGYISLFQGTISSATYEYEPAANEWITRAPMPLADTNTIRVGITVSQSEKIQLSLVFPFYFTPHNKRLPSTRFWCSSIPKPGEEQPNTPIIHIPQLVSTPIPTIQEYYS